MCLVTYGLFCFVLFNLIIFLTAEFSAFIYLDCWLIYLDMFLPFYFMLFVLLLSVFVLVCLFFLFLRSLFSLPFKKLFEMGVFFSLTTFPSTGLEIICCVSILLVIHVEIPPYMLNKDKSYYSDPWKACGLGRQSLCRFKNPCITSDSLRLY